MVRSVCQQGNSVIQLLLSATVHRKAVEHACAPRLRLLVVESDSGPRGASFDMLSPNGDATELLHAYFGTSEEPFSMRLWSMQGPSINCASGGNPRYIKLSQGLKSTCM